MPKIALVTISADAPQPATAARQALAAAQARKAEVEAAYARGCATLERVSGLAGIEGTARAKLEAAQGRASEAISAWARAGAQGEAPTAGDDLVQLQREADTAAATASAARGSQSDLQRENEAARRALEIARSDVATAVHGVLLGDAAAVEAELAAAFMHIMTLKTRLGGLGMYMERTPGGSRHINALMAMIEQPQPQPTQPATLACAAAWRRHADLLFADPEDQINWE